MLGLFENFTISALDHPKHPTTLGTDQIDVALLLSVASLLLFKEIWHSQSKIRPQMSI